MNMRSVDPANTYVGDFRKRWSMSLASAEAVVDFRNRALGSMKTVLGDQLLNNSGLSDDFLHALGEPTVSEDWHYITAPEQTPLWLALERRTVLSEFVFGLQVLFHLGLDRRTQGELVQLFRDDIAASGVPVSFGESNGSFTFYPKGAQLLDDSVINADLNWLCDYPRALDAFTKALLLYGSTGQESETLNRLRICVEELGREMLGNELSLEKNAPGLLALFKDVLSTETRNMTHSLLEYYTKYQNEHVKHGTDWRPVEVAFILYLTATFVYLLVTAYPGKHQ